jgi:zinc and cadmium transporter
MIWIYTLSSVFLVSLISLVGVLTLFFNEKILRKALIYLVSLSAGTLLGGAFLHLIPESFSDGTENASFYILLGIILFFILEKVIHWRHCHEVACEDHLHNFIDGVLIAASFLVSVPLGIGTTIAVIFHEIPQELGDFGSLIYAGFSKVKALMFNFLSALSAVVGAVVVLIMGSNFSEYISLMIPITAGGFIYIAMADLMPELKKTKKIGQSLGQIVFLLIGIGIMIGLLFFE